MVMFSATWPMEVHKLAQEFMDPNPVKVCFPLFLSRTLLFHFSQCYHSIFFQVVIGSVDLAANHDVLQIIEVCFLLSLCK